MSINKDSNIALTMKQTIAFKGIVSKVNKYGQQATGKCWISDIDCFLVFSSSPALPCSSHNFSPPSHLLLPCPGQREGKRRLVLTLEAHA